MLPYLAGAEDGVIIKIKSFDTKLSKKNFLELENACELNFKID